MTSKMAASFFISEASELKENDLTNLKLQKILYFAQAEVLKKSKGKALLFPDDIEAWKYGPVVPTVYDWLKTCGSFTISSFDIELEDASTIGESNRTILKAIWDNYNKYSASYLVRLTHRPGSPWSLVFNKNEKIGSGNGDVIRPELLLNDRVFL